MSCFACCSKDVLSDNDDISAERGDSVREAGSGNTFSFLELAQKFRASNVLGEGVFGKVYKGTLATGEVVAVKQLDLSGNQGLHEFHVEVEILSCLEHPNLVKLKGCCTDRDQRVLVYEFLPNGSLYDHLFAANNRNPLNWKTRVKIALGAARGLQYLHSEASPPVIHRDLKSANILLDNDFNPKLADFGSHVTTRVMDTDGYCDPEYAMSGKITLKSDIYSFGVVLLELLTGRQALDLRLREGEEQLVDWFFREAQPLMQDPESHRIMRVLDPLLGVRFSDPLPPLVSVLDLLVTVDKCLREGNRPSVGPELSVLLRYSLDEYSESTGGL